MTPSPISRTLPNYGSQSHLLSYRDNAAAILDKAITEAVVGELANPLLEWIYPLRNETRPEPTGTTFLTLDADQQRAWKEFWPQGGTPQTWDGIARFDSLPGPGPTWVLIEAKANHPEFCSPPSGAAGSSLTLIKKTLAETKAALGVHHLFPWHGTYYQYANRLAFLYFLGKIHIRAHFVFLYFYGDRFPDGTACPGSPNRWRELIHACHLTLGLGDSHMLRPQMHDVFLRVPAPRSAP